MNATKPLPKPAGGEEGVCHSHVRRRQLVFCLSATSLLGGVFRNERPETISVKQAEARGMTARLFASLFCHGGSCSMAAKPLFLPKVFSKKPKSIIQKGNFEKTFATIFNFFSRFEFSQNEACAYRKGASVRKYVDDRHGWSCVDDRHGWSCVCGRVPHCASAFRSCMPARNNTNQPQSNSFRRFCTAET